MVLLDGARDGVGVADGLEEVAAHRRGGADLARELRQRADIGGEPVELALRLRHLAGEDRVAGRRADLEPRVDLADERLVALRGVDVLGAQLLQRLAVAGGKGLEAAGFLAQLERALADGGGHALRGCGARGALLGRGCGDLDARHGRAGRLGACGGPQRLRGEAAGAEAEAQGGHEPGPRGAAGKRPGGCAHAGGWHVQVEISL